MSAHSPLVSVLKEENDELLTVIATVDLLSKTLAERAFPTALALLDEARRRLPRSHALQYHISRVFSMFAGRESDLDVKNFLVQQAVESARTISTFSRMKIDYCLQHAKLLTEMGDANSYVEAANICRAALDVKNPSVTGLFNVNVEEAQKKLQWILKECQSSQAHTRIRWTMSDAGRSGESSDQRSAVERYWNEVMTPEQRSNFFKVGLEELRRYWKDALPQNQRKKVLEHLEEALGILKEHHSLVVFDCLSCKSDTKFKNASDYLHHQKHTHDRFGQLPYNLRKMIPVEVGQDVKIKFINKMMRALDLKDRSDPSDPCPFTLSDDFDRNRLFSQIQMLMSVLIHGNCLFKCHVQKIAAFAGKSVCNRSFGTTSDRWVICLRLLDATGLSKVLQFLEELLLLFHGGCNSKDEFTVPSYQDGHMISFHRGVSGLELDRRMFEGENGPDDIDLRKMLAWLYDEKRIQEWELNSEPRLKYGGVVQSITKESELLKEMCTAKLVMLDTIHVKNEDIECEDWWTIEEFLSHENDSVVKIVMINATITKSLRTAKQQQKKLLECSLIDHREQVVFLMKTFMRTRLEKEMERDAIKRSEAAALELIMATAGEYSRQKSKKKKNKNKKGTNNKYETLADTKNMDISEMGEVTEKKVLTTQGTEENGNSDKPEVAAENIAANFPEMEEVSKHKRAPLKLGFADLKAYWTTISSQEQSYDILEVLPKAISLLEDHGVMSLWSCYRCEDAAFLSALDYSNHRTEYHDIPKNLQSIIPMEVDLKWKLMLQNEDMRPIDHFIAAKMLIPKEKKNQSDGNKLMTKGWPPLVDDAERTRLLNKIQNILFSLVAENILFASHLKKVTDFSEDAISQLSFGSFEIHSMELPSSVDRSLFYLSCLDAPQLKQILAFFEMLLYIFDEGNNPSDDEKHTEQSSYGKVNVKITLDHTSECLVMDIESTKPEEVQSIAETVAVWRQSYEKKQEHGKELSKSIKRKFAYLETLCRKKVSLLKELNGVESHEFLSEDCWTMQDYLHDKNDHVTKLVKMDAIIGRLHRKIKQLEQKLMQCSCVDFTIIIATLTKICIKEHHTDKRLKNPEADGSQTTIMGAQSMERQREEKKAKKKNKGKKSRGCEIKGM